MIFTSKELNHETTSEFLHQIIELWPTIQEFSAASSWMKYYKQKRAGTIGQCRLQENLQKGLSTEMDIED